MSTWSLPGFWGSKLGPHIHLASTLTTEQSPQPSGHFYLLVSHLVLEPWSLIPFVHFLLACLEFVYGLFKGF